MINTVAREIFKGNAVFWFQEGSIRSGPAVSFGGAEDYGLILAAIPVSTLILLRNGTRSAAIING